MVDEDIAGNELPAHINPAEIRRGLVMGQQDGRSREQVYFETQIRKVEPDLVGRPDKLEQYLALFKADMVNDLRLIAFDAKAEFVDGKVVLTGHTEYEEIRETLLRYLHYLGFQDVDDRIEALPAESLGEKKYAIVNISHAYSYDRPQTPRETMTNDFLGDTVYLLKETEDGYFLCHTSEGYVGYIDGAHLRRVDAAELNAYLSGPRAVFQRNHRVGDLLIPAGSRLKLLGRQGGEARIQLPSGEDVTVPGEIVIRRAAVPRQNVVEAIEVAHEMLGTRYVWGGKTTEGVDCSGLVQSAFRSQGINLPRDAYMQAYVGTLVGTRWHRDAMRAGDLIYFLGSRGKIHHTAIYLGDGKYIEATGPVVKISSFNPDDPEYERRRDATFCFAKRVIE